MPDVAKSAVMNYLDMFSKIVLILRYYHVAINSEIVLGTLLGLKVDAPRKLKSKKTAKTSPTSGVLVDEKPFRKANVITKFDSPNFLRQSNGNDISRYRQRIEHRLVVVHIKPMGDTTTTRRFYADDGKHDADWNAEAQLMLLTQRWPG
ncbi:uncharacterized protein N0V89_000643 [Didymosphaeria variabile]|uniref:Uncharacterized protein n=1 Tax=Didymosphaeria variabile TaxID=1932322 RepID=A0A9W8XUP2_9PLEO|nr:uncharacterized protein N0V89_000643 [Didymosphaeria variabile]KAJ4360084.1 hypothetical protein N0V89_000643 [Didymosphaeria variabile]